LAKQFETHQEILYSIRHDFFNQNPSGRDLAQPYQVAKATLFKDAINDWQVLNNGVYFNWQEFILRSGTNVKIESVNWLDDTLQMSLEKTLHVEVESDLCSLPIS
jgi:hypothetical protein